MIRLGYLTSSPGVITLYTTYATGGNATPWGGGGGINVSITVNIFP